MSISKRGVLVKSLFLFFLFFLIQHQVFSQLKTIQIPKGTYQNPILGGDYADPSILRDGKDYYLTHSSFIYFPGLLIWHSTDLIHWKRIGHALTKNVGSVFAPDLVKYKDKYYIYFPANRKMWVVTAPSMSGPWSEPVDLQLAGYIDPGHAVGADGKRYLFLNKGSVVELTDDGLAVVGQPKVIYEGWKFPDEWNTECFCLESPKITSKNGYFYMTSAEGGTAGPATSHLVVSARSKSPFGPWENSPYNPIIHTASRDERWWSQGHGTLVDDVKGNYWMIYHGYEKGFNTLGRQTLMMPVEWTKDGWFRVPPKIKSSDYIRQPTSSSPDSVMKKEADLSDNFESDKLSLQWQFFKYYKPERIELKAGKLVFSAEGNSFENSAPLLTIPADRRYEIQVEYNIENGVEAGLTLFYNEAASIRFGASRDNLSVIVPKNGNSITKNTIGNHGFLKLINEDNEISFYSSTDGQRWSKVPRGLEVSGFNHNIFGGFFSLRIGLYAFGNGKVEFDNFTYKKR